MNKKITDLTELVTPVDGDYLAIVDVSDTTDDAAGTSKKVKFSKFSNWVNVANYGATGDGTTDDTSAIEAAIAALNVYSGGYGGATLFFPFIGIGIYKVTSSIRILSGMRILGQGQHSPLIRGDVAGAIFYADGNGGASTVQYITFDNIFVRNTNTTAAAMALSLDWVSHFTLRDSEFNSSGGYALFSSDSVVGLIDGCNFGGAGSEIAAYFDSNANIINIKNSTFKDSKGGIRVDDGQAVNIVGNHFEDLVGGATYDASIVISNVDGGTIEGNYFEANPQELIQFRDTYGTNTGWVIGGNWLTGMSAYAINAYALTHSTILSNYHQATATDVNAWGVVMGVNSSNCVIMPQRDVDMVAGHIYSDSGTDNIKLGTW